MSDREDLLAFLRERGISLGVAIEYLKQAKKSPKRPKEKAVLEKYETR